MVGLHTGVSQADANAGNAEMVVVNNPGTPAPSTPGVRGQVVRTEAGQERFRVRNEGPWILDPGAGRNQRGSAQLAEEIASSADRVHTAVNHFRGMIYASSTSATKNALFSLWMRLCQRRGVAPLPLTAEVILINSGILKEAGYKMVVAYLSEAKDRHVRSGFLWTAELQATFQDVKRASKRAQGETKRAEEVRYEWWEWLIKTCGWRPLAHAAADDAPVDPMDMIVGQNFLLREVELSSIFLDRWCIRLDRHAKTIGLFLPVSKCDQEGSGVLRTLGCSCKTVLDVLCPYHAALRVVDLQLCRFGYESLDDVPIAW